MKAIVFGGTGFIGLRLVAALETNGASVKVASDKGTPREVRVDVATGEGFENMPRDVDTVFNMASLISSKNPKDSRFMEVNARGAKNVAAYAREAGAWLVHSSSASVYGKPAELPVREDSEKRPESEYARSKLEGERLCTKETEDARLTILRYSSVYGPGSARTSVLPIFTQKALEGKELVVQDPARTQDFVFVDDVVEANLLFAGKRKMGTFNIGSGKETSMLELAETIVRVTSSKSSIRLDKEAPASGFRMRLDISSAKRMGFKPRFTLEKGLEKTIEASLT